MSRYNFSYTFRKLIDVFWCKASFYKELLSDVQQCSEHKRNAAISYFAVLIYRIFAFKYRYNYKVYSTLFILDVPYTLLGIMYGERDLYWYPVWSDGRPITKNLPALFLLAPCAVHIIQNSTLLLFIFRIFNMYYVLYFKSWKYKGN